MSEWENKCNFYSPKIETGVDFNIDKGEPVCIWVCKVQSYFIRSVINVVQSTILITDSAQSKHNARV